jgi:hypothetical protein
VPPEEEEDEEAVEVPALPVEEYQPPDLSEEEEALRRAIEESDLIELANWVGLGAQLAAFAPTSGADMSTTRAAPPPPPPPLEPQPSGYAVGVAASRASHSGELGLWGIAEPQTPPQMSPQPPSQAPTPAAPGVSMVPWPYP